MQKLLMAAAVVGLATSAADAGLMVQLTNRVAGANWDQLTFKLTGWDGTDATVPGNGVTSISGTFTALGTDPVMSFQGADSAEAASYTTRTGRFGSADVSIQSFVNFDSTTPGFTRTPDAEATGAVNGGWFTTSVTAGSGDRRLKPANDPATSGFDDALVATIYVSPGDNVQFSGVYNSTANISAPLNFTSVPEPVLAGLLPVGALLLGRRRRS